MKLLMALTVLAALMTSPAIALQVAPMHGAAYCDKDKPDEERVGTSRINPYTSPLYEVPGKGHKAK